MQHSWPDPSGFSLGKNKSFEKYFPSWPTMALPQELLIDKIRNEQENSYRRATLCSPTTPCAQVNLKWTKTCTLGFYVKLPTHTCKMEFTF